MAKARVVPFRKRISWRDVFSPKTTTLPIERIFDLALEAGYEYFEHTGRIYKVECSACWVETQQTSAQII